ncbi:MAG: N-acetylmuramoyl-L-alanine amidase [Gammaproteobacteria bacterium]
MQRRDSEIEQTLRSELEAGHPDTIVIHYTAGGSVESAVQTLSDPARKASAHVVVGRDGSITQLVPFQRIAWHAGRSSFQGRSGVNRYAIGIEIDNAGRLQQAGSRFTSWFGRDYQPDEVVEAVHRHESAPAPWHRYTEAQIGQVEALCEALITI